MRDIIKKIIACPKCKSDLIISRDAIECKRCKLEFPIKDDSPVLEYE